jgi:hypothetical protein
MLWWLANIIFAAVIVPVVVTILITVLNPIREIRAYADDITEHGGLFGPHLEATAELATTAALVRDVKGGLVQYIQAIDRIG